MFSLIINRFFVLCPFSPGFVNTIIGWRFVVNTKKRAWRVCHPIYFQSCLWTFQLEIIRIWKRVFALAVKGGYKKRFFKIRLELFFKKNNRKPLTIEPCQYTSIISGDNVYKDSCRMVFASCPMSISRHTNLESVINKAEDETFGFAYAHNGMTLKK